VAVLDWILDSDPSIRWQALRDLVDAPPEVVAAERARVASEGWGARLLALQGEDGQWEGGALFPGRRRESAGGDPSDQNEGQSASDDSEPRTLERQPWTATAYSLVLLRDFGVDPSCDRVRRAVALVRDHCRWEHAGQAFFSGEVEPCINGLTIALGAYFDQDVDSVVARLLGEQLEDGGWNCWTEYGSVRSSFATTIRVLEGLLAHERASGGSAESIAARGRGERISSNESCSGARALAKSSTRPGCNSHFQPAGTTTCCVPWSTSEKPAIRRTSGSTKRFNCSAPRSSRMARGCWRTHIPAKSISCLKAAMVGPAGGTRCGRSVSCAGTGNQLAERTLRPRSAALGRRLGGYDHRSRQGCAVEL
jgi:hypothetical protein